MVVSHTMIHSAKKRRSTESTTISPEKNTQKFAENQTQHRGHSNFGQKENETSISANIE